MAKAPIIIGLTGGIGTGKSTAATMFAKLGLPVHSADDAVHKLLGKGGKAVKPIAKLFPDAVKAGAVDRQALGKIVFGNAAKLKKLEDIMHPLVQKDERDFVKKARAKKAVAVVLEIPLLFETGAHLRCDCVVVVTASLAERKKRVLKRKGMTAAKFNAIVKAQMPETEKRAYADFLVATDKGLAHTKAQVKAITELSLAAWWFN